MSGEIEAVGAAATAGLVAGAIETTPTPDDTVHGAEAHGVCANCGANLTGNFCATCGQPAHVHRTLGHMVEEFLHGLLHFDTRAWRTLPMLVFRPGTLTHDYIHGKRVRFISPLAIYLLSVFTMFAVFAFTGGAPIEADEKPVEVVVVEPATPTSVAPTPETGAEDNAAADVDEVEPGTLHERDDVFEQIKHAYESGQIKVETPFPYLDKKIKHKLENPELAFYKIQNAAYKFAFLLVPISLPLVWLLFFWKRGFTLFDHTVYILYSLSYVSLLFIVMAAFSRAPDFLQGLIPLLLISIPVHAYFQMKGAYSLGWFSALWRVPVMMILATLGLSFFLIAIVLVGLTG
ncbi:MAG TPA: DUF3667 domain-containing protein [Hyphomonadaceae bacterium]|nr:DUF3667 domain-containing protein [Hyphomonadaceae bacterium]